jgi:putative thioredoxin
MIRPLCMILRSQQEALERWPPRGLDNGTLTEDHARGNIREEARKSKLALHSFRGFSYDNSMNHEIADFATDVLERSKTTPVVVDFWAAWCGPCRVLGPILERLAERDRDRWVLAKVDTDKHQDLAARYGVRGIPHVKLFVDGKVVGEFTGALPERAVEQWLAKVLPGKHQKDLEAAQLLVAREDYAAARPILEGILDHEPDNEQARVLLAGMFISSDPAKAASLVARIEEHSKHFPLAEAIRTFAVLLEKAAHPENLPEGEARMSYSQALDHLAKNDYDRALENFIEVIRRDRSYDDDGARRAVVAMFRILGDEHPLTQKYRRPFSSALNA